MSEHAMKDKVVLIAGGAKNLGGLVARDFAASGARAITIHYNSDATKAAAEETVAAIEAAGAKAFAVQGDLTQVSACRHLFKKPLVETTEAEFDQMFAVNTKSAYFFLQEAAKALNDGGKICTIVTSLLGAFTGLYSTYAGAKAAVDQFTRAAAKELGPRGISVTAVAPGPMDTPFFYGQESPEAVAYHKSASALGGLTDIKDIAPLVKFLVTDGWWITGQTIFADGGYTTR